MSLYVADLLPFEIDANKVNDCLKTLSQPFIKYLADDAPTPDVIKLIVGCANAKRTTPHANSEPQKQSATAPEFLTAGIAHMQDRASTYDAPAGERSMAKTVAMFNLYAGTAITEEQGWHFMEILKMVRASQGEFKADNYEDGAAYAALAGEAAARERGKN